MDFITQSTSKQNSVLYLHAKNIILIIAWISVWLLTASSLGLHQWRVIWWAWSWALMTHHFLFQQIGHIGKISGMIITYIIEVLRTSGLACKPEIYLPLIFYVSVYTRGKNSEYPMILDHYRMYIPSENHEMHFCDVWTIFDSYLWVTPLWFFGLQL